MSNVITVTDKPTNLINPNSVSFKEREQQLKHQEEVEKRTEKKQKDSIFNKFIQMNIDEKMNVARKTLIKENPNAYILFDFMASNMDGYNAIMASYRVFEEQLNSSKATVGRAIKKLEENGFIYIQKSGRSNIYILNPDIVWKSWGKNKKYCKFPANIVLAKSEQNQDNPHSKTVISKTPKIDIEKLVK